jgi:hypothetical protein
MNKRLKELARQAKQSNPNLIWEDSELERFADLVRQDYLRELNTLKPVAYYNKKHDTVITAYELGNHVDGNDVPLYPLEASNENASLP